MCGLFFYCNLFLFIVTFLLVPNEPKRVIVQAVNSTTIFVEWRAPRSKERNGIIRGYYVYYAELDENNDPIPQTEDTKDTNDGSKTEMVITGLKPDTMYQVTVAGYTRRGDGLRSRPKTINTKGAGKLALTNFAFSRNSKRRIIPFLSGLLFVHLKLVLFQNDLIFFNVCYMIMLYMYFTVPSEPRHLVTELIQPDPPIAQVTWSKPEFPNGQITGYKLYWGRKGKIYQQISLKANQQSYITQSLGKIILQHPKCSFLMSAWFNNYHTVFYVGWSQFCFSHLD